MCNAFNWTSSRQDLVVLDPNVIGECLVRHPDLPPSSYKGSSPPQRVASALFRFPLLPRIVLQQSQSKNEHNGINTRRRRAVRFGPHPGRVPRRPRRSLLR